ncbi:MAG: thioredoxin family protein [Sulfurimonas sp.]|jgi:thioredoxin-related protein
MRKILLLTLLLATSLFAQIEWMKLKDATTKAKAENKIVMVILSKEGCPACEFMDDRVLKDEKVLAEMGNRFIGVHLDIRNDFIPEDLTFIGAPTIHFIDAHGIKIDRIDGALNVKNFIEAIKEIKDE